MQVCFQIAMCILHIRTQLLYSVLYKTMYNEDDLNFSNYWTPTLFFVASGRQSQVFSGNFHLIIASPCLTCLAKLSPSLFFILFTEYT